MYQAFNTGENFYKSTIISYYNNFSFYLVAFF